MNSRSVALRHFVARVVNERSVRSLNALGTLTTLAKTIVNFGFYKAHFIAGNNKGYAKFCISDYKFKSYKYDR